MSAIITADDLSELELSDLPSLAGTIQWEFEKSEKAFETALHHGIACGHALIAAKAKVPHGSWMSWVEGNTTISHSTVNMFMSLASNSQRVENLETIREALKLLAEDRREARRIVSETYVPYEGEESIVRVKVETPEPQESIVRVKVETTDFTEPRPSPASSVIMDAEIVEPSAQDIETEPIDEEPEEAPEPAPQKPPADSIPKWIPDDADRLWTLAHIHLQKILPSDKSRERVLNEVVAYCHGRLDQKRDALAAIIGTLPRLTQSEIKSLIETLNTRWT